MKPDFSLQMTRLTLYHANFDALTRHLNRRFEYIEERLKEPVIAIVEGAPPVYLPITTRTLASWKDADLNDMHITVEIFRASRIVPKHNLQTNVHFHPSIYDRILSEEYATKGQALEAAQAEADQEGFVRSVGSFRSCLGIEDCPNFKFHHLSKQWWDENPIIIQTLGEDGRVIQEDRYGIS